MEKKVTKKTETKTEVKTNDLLPKNYKLPEVKSGREDYLKFEAGDNEVRCVGQIYPTWRYFDKNNKPHFFPDDQKPLLEDSTLKVQHTWIFPAYNIKKQKVQVAEVSQQGVLKALQALIDDSNWGDIRQYNIVVNKKGEMLETKYQVRQLPPKPLSEEIKKAVSETPVHVPNLYVGKDPFDLPENF